MPLTVIEKKSNVGNEKSNQTRCEIELQNNKCFSTSTDFLALLQTPTINNIDLLLPVHESKSIDSHSLLLGDQHILSAGQVSEASRPILSHTYESEHSYTNTVLSDAITAGMQGIEKERHLHFTIYFNAHISVNVEAQFTGHRFVCKLSTRDEKTRKTMLRNKEKIGNTLCGNLRMPVDLEIV